MFFQKIIISTIVVASVTLPAFAGKCSQKYPRDQVKDSGRCGKNLLLSELVECASKGSGTDDIHYDFDIFRELVDAAELGPTLDDFDQHTIFMPYDMAFCHLAESLGCIDCHCKGSYHEDNALKYLTDNLDKNTTIEVLKYHVSPDKYTFDNLRGGLDINTLLGGDAIVISEVSSARGNSCPQDRIRLEDTGRIEFGKGNYNGWTHIHNKHHNLYINGGKSIAHSIKNVLLTKEALEP